MIASKKICQFQAARHSFTASKPSHTPFTSFPRMYTLIKSVKTLFFV